MRPNYSAWGSGSGDGGGWADGGGWGDSWGYYANRVFVLPDDLMKET